MRSTFSVLIAIEAALALVRPMARGAKINFRRISASGGTRHKLVFARLLRGNPRPHQVVRDASFAR